MLLFMRRTDPALSLTWQELRVVVLPSLKTSYSSTRSENLALGQIPSSIEIVIGFLSLVFGMTIIVDTIFYHF